MIVNTVAQYYATDKEKIVKKVKGRIEEFEVSFATSNIKKKRSQNKKFDRKIEKIIDLNVRKVT